MKKILFFVLNLLVCIGIADAAVRDGTSSARAKTGRTVSQSRVATTPKRTTSKTSVLTPRSAKPVAKRTNTDAQQSRTQNVRSVSSRNAKNAGQQSVISRAASDNADKKSMSDTRTGAEYEKCKNTYFSCMDQFCTLKNDDYRRCSCSDRIFDMIDQRKTLEDANEQLTAFTESLEAVGMTAAQATAMKQASEGENALTSDKSASKALLQAIMNSISGKDANVGGKYSDLNSINISFDTANAFGLSDAGQAIAAYNGVALYSAVYPQCRQAVKKDCTDASLQRAVTAYLMAIEQDCNTVQTAIGTTQKQLKAAVREGDAMLDLARVENRQKHNSSDLTTCINEIETAILDEQVCGKNYHKCLDNGEFIDVSTGKPIAGVVHFDELGKLLKFASGVDASKQKLSKISDNRTFIQNFESRYKQFAASALDKCVEQADIAWADYLDKALLDIYYAQQSKVQEIKQACFDFVSSCYVNADKSITAAMQSLTTGNEIVVNPDKIVLTDKMCSDYVGSCDNMFSDGNGGGIIEEYISNQKNTDMVASCRAVAKQCFDKYGGTNYENFFYPYSGLFTPGTAPDWFALQEYTVEKITTTENGQTKITYEYTPEQTVSTCAKQLQGIDACTGVLTQVFGGLNKYIMEDNSVIYGVHAGEVAGTTHSGNEAPQIRYTRPTGVATEVYNQVLSVLSTQCMNVNGRFVEYQNVSVMGLYNSDSLCTIKTYNNIPDLYMNIKGLYGLDMGDSTKTEYMCPRNYDTSVDTQSWGICSCWENGGRRSQNNYTTKCVEKYYGFDAVTKKNSWISGPALSSDNQVCVYYVQANATNDDKNAKTLEIKCVNEKIDKCCVDGHELGTAGVCSSVDCSEKSTNTAAEKANCCNGTTNICNDIECPSFNDLEFANFPDGI